MNSNTLYEIKVKLDTAYEALSNNAYVGTEKVIYGTYLATNSAGQYVMEEKGTGKIITANKEDVSEVVPYTIEVKFLSGHDNGTIYPYTSEKDKFQVGDLCLLKNQNGTSLVLVENVDTKSKKATKDFTPISKVVTEKF